jgi:hypothetical protein
MQRQLVLAISMCESAVGQWWLRSANFPQTAAGDRSALGCTSMRKSAMACSRENMTLRLF